MLERGRILLEQKDTDSSFETDKMSRRFYKACINEKETENLGVEPLLKSLDEIGGWPVLNNNSYHDSKWYEQNIAVNKVGWVAAGGVITHGFAPDAKNNSFQVLHFDQPQFIMGREYLIKGFEDKYVQAYYQYMVDVAVLLGAKESKAKEELKETLMFEIILANSSTPTEERRDDNKLYNPTTLKDLEEEVSKIEEPGHPPSWQKYIQQLISDGINYEEASKAIDITIQENEKVIIKDPAYFKVFGKILLKTNPKVVANYMGWLAVLSNMKYLNKAAENINHKFDKALSGVTAKEPSWKHCVTSSGFGQTYISGGGAASSMYVRAYFKPEDKKVIDEMISYLRSSFNNIINNLDWMDNETKEEAKKKLKEMDQSIGYPVEVIDKEKVDGLHKGKNSKIS